MADDAKTDKSNTVKVVDIEGGETWGRDQVALKFPFKLAGVTYTRVDFRVPNGRDIDAYYRDLKAGNRELAMSLSELDETVFDAMHGSDYARVMGAVGKYVAGSL